MKSSLIFTALFITFIFWFGCTKNVPEVTITSPQDGDVVSGYVDITVEATDQEGVVRVEFYIDDSLEYTAPDTPYVYTWETYGLEDSSYHDIYAKAYDGDGNEAVSDTINVMVDNHGAVGSCNMLEITQAIINNETLSVSSPEITVQINSSIIGQVTLQAINLGEPGWVVPLAGTPSWGNHSTSYWGINSSIPVDTSIQTTDVDLTASADTGLYYIYFVWNHQMDYADVMSLTDWTYSGGPVCDDGVDVADWPDSLAQNAIDRGYVSSEYLWGDGNYGLRNIPQRSGFM